jgi:O-antigen/teichoic acid export membrane protein
MAKAIMEVEVEKKKIDSLSKRYFFKFTANLFSFLISLLTAGIIPRGLGPEAFGNFSFITDFFNQVVGFLDSGTSLGFYTKLTQRLYDRALVKFYWRFVMLASGLISLVIWGIISSGYGAVVWPDQNYVYVYMGLIFGLLTWGVKISGNIIDAYGYTVRGEIVKIIQKIIGTVLILLMFVFEYFSLSKFFFYHYIILAILVFGTWYQLRKSGVALFPAVKLTKLRSYAFSKEFYKYSMPLLSYSFVGLMVSILDRWMLQKFAGSVEQGFYGLAFKVSSVCFIFSGALVPLFMREFSVAFGSKNIIDMRELFSKFIPMLYFFAAYISIFVAVHSGTISLLLGGEKFSDASLAIGIMSLYPIHQTYGQLTGSVYYATGRTKQYRNISFIYMAFGLLMAYVLIAPSNFLGFGLGSIGLSIKMVVVQIIAVNILLWYTARYLNLSFWMFFSHQFYVILLFGGIAYLSKYLVDYAITNDLFAFIFSGILYTLLSLLALLIYPKMASLTSDGIKNLINKILKKIKP